MLTDAPREPRKIRYSLSDFTNDLDGYKQYRVKSGRLLADSSQRKWHSIIEKAEALRAELHGEKEWSEFKPEEIAFDFMQKLYDRCKGRRGGRPSDNTLRGRYDACYSYFEFLELTQYVPINPLRLLKRPPSKPAARSFLDPSEDAALARLAKHGNEVALYALLRGAGLRVDEAIELDDDDVDLDNSVVHVRGGRTDGKTVAATRDVPISRAAATQIGAYRRWRDKNMPVSRKFLRTESGSMSSTWAWMLVKEMARRAGLRTLCDDDGNPVLDAEGRPFPEAAPHTLRRTFGAELYRRGVPIKMIAQVMGHANERVTYESYVRVLKKETAETVVAALEASAFGASVPLHLMQETLAEVANLDAARALAAVRDLQAAAKRLEDELAREVMGASVDAPAVGTSIPLSPAA